MTQAEQRRKVNFPLEKDEDGYPPFDWEGIWAEPAGEGFWLLDNIPFFVYEISNRDIVRANEEDGRLVFDQVHQRQGHSTLRIIFEDLDLVDVVRATLKQMGCATEGAHSKRLVAVDVGPDVSLKEVRAYLTAAMERGGLEFEDACDQHGQAED
ncbi:MAG TPA: DUF4265 domain-containing protein [Aquabacterium sp.]|uniref:DUF4265 domain-containing protein n=1 Tax=Aquabacterium sp. TaxID=1872578 RepID=UPI002E3188C2|nr:DUF4265 domain-containing protein [Aquabacterium sp.]HEX5357228.1 DUF4265 domain-containing protein [Aquabacterium sp.]